MTVVVTGDEASVPAALAFVGEVRELARLPKATRSVALVGDYETCLSEAPQSDLDIMGIMADPDMAFVARTVALTRSSCLFAGDSGKENAAV